MKFLADESCDFIIVKTLRKAGYDVIATAEDSPGISDTEIIHKTISDGRILLTEDKDFGQLAFANRPLTQTIILLRFPAKARKDISKTVLEFIQKHSSDMQGCFAVLQPGRIRITRIV